MNKRLVVGLIGGIGSGKSSVAGIFSDLGATVIDADAIAHQMLERPNVIRKLAGIFGKSILDKGCGIVRGALAKKAFAGKKMVEKLNAVTHPEIGKEIDRRIKAARRSAKLIILDAALLLESGAAERRCDTLVYIQSPARVRQGRVRATRGWSPRELLRRSRWQLPLNLKRKRAEYMINNGGPRTETFQQVKKLFKRLAISC